MAEKKLNYSGTIANEFPLFQLKVNDDDLLTIDLSQVSIINSIGVKSWIIWAMKLPENAKVIFENCPFVIVNQAASVVGFLTKHMEIRSFFAFFNCPKCNAETLVKLENGKNYWHDGVSEPKWVLPTDLQCKKCHEILEADFIPEKVFTFLKKI